MNVSTVVRRALLSVAFLLASPLVLAQASSVTAAPSASPAIIASPVAPSSPSLDQAHATVKADVAKLRADRTAHASEAQIALDKGNLRADVKVLRSAHVPGQPQTGGDHHHGHHGHHHHGHHGHHHHGHHGHHHHGHHAAPSTSKAVSAVPASSVQ